MRIENLDVYQKFCQLHTEIYDMSSKWPSEEQESVAIRHQRPYIHERKVIIFINVPHSASPE